MKRWRTKNSFLIFFVLVAFSILQNELKFRKLYQDQSHADDAQGRNQGSLVKDSSFFISTPTQNVTLPKKPPVGLDKFTKCSSTVPYSGRRLAWGVHKAGLSGGRETVQAEACNLFSGKWVFDNTSRPLYNESDCPYMADQLACHKMGRPDSAYQFWRWQPHNCNLKRWNAAEVWEKLRGKRLMFVGDSLNRGQWTSLLCLLQSVIPRDKQSLSPNSELRIFRAENYNATVEFLWAPLLVESNSDDPADHRLTERILHPDTVLRHSSRWESADILVFNTFLWWRQGPVKLLWSDQENMVCEEINALDGMEMVMDTWADWVSTHIDPLEKKVFFVTMSPLHYSKDDWEPGSQGNCYGEIEPIFDENYWGAGLDLPIMRMVDKVLSRLGSKVSVVNITQLSKYRKDGHPTIYRRIPEPLTPEKKANPASYADCSHWCLPGVSDVWNELLFQIL